MCNGLNDTNPMPQNSRAKFEGNHHPNNYKEKNPFPHEISSI
jgi:hypothetical protein